MEVDVQLCLTSPRHLLPTDPTLHLIASASSRTQLFECLVTDIVRSSLTSSPTMDTESNLTNSSHSALAPTPWLRDRYLNQVERHELIAQGYSLRTMNIITELDPQNLRDAVNFLPTASFYGGGFTGWKRKAPTWPKRVVERRRTF